jgi:hypothetical protein
MKVSEAKKIMMGYHNAHSKKITTEAAIKMI